MLLHFHTSLFLVLQVLVFTTKAKDNENISWVNASANILSQIYTKHDHCIITSALHSRGSDFKSDTNTFETTCSQPDNIIEKRCSTFASYAYHQNTLGDNFIPESMTQVLSNLSSRYPYINRITDLLIQLNESNRALVLVGDSITRNSIESLFCILQIENSFSSRVTITPPLEKVLYNAIHYTISFPRATLHLLYFSIWHPFQPGKGGTTTAFHGELQHLLFNKKYPNLGAVVVFNIGIHERGQKRMTKNLIEMFSFMKDILIPTTSNRNVSFLYRESSVQHYDNPAGTYNINTAKKWHSGELSSPICQPWLLGDADNAKDWRYHAEQSALKSSEFISQNIIFFRDLSKKYWDTHGASPYFQGRSRGHTSGSKPRKRHPRSGKSEDCTHFIPTAAPLLYRLLWHQILVH